MKIKSILLILILASEIAVFSQSNEFKWQKSGGNWEVKDSRATETHGYTSGWDYYYLSNYNMIFSLQDFKDFNAIEFTAEMFDREKSPVELAISFAVRSEYKSWYYHMYAIRFTGDFWNIDKVELIHSDRQDKSLPYTAKNNRFVKVLASGKCKIKYGKAYNYRITFEGDLINLFINGEKVFTATRPARDLSGKIAISSGNAKLSIDRVRVLKDNTVLFEDEFDTNTIYVRKIKASLEVKPGDDNNKDQNQQ